MNIGLNWQKNRSLSLGKIKYYGSKFNYLSFGLIFIVTQYISSTYPVWEEKERKGMDRKERKG